jgi:hypothetical protein
MKTGILIVVLMLVSNRFYAQNNTGNEQRKAEKAARIEKEYRATEKMIDSASFVLRADYLENQIGFRKIVQPTLNFIEVDSSQVVIQTGNNQGIGYNGVGGLTVKGNIVSWNVQKDLKHKTFVIRMGISSSLGYYDVFMNVNAAGRTTARLSGTSKGELIFDGNINPLDESITYQGSTI